MNKRKNLACDNVYCKDPNGEVRLLPYGGSGNMILCKHCFNLEIRSRREWNKEQGEKVWDLPKWESLSIYEVS